MFVVFLTFLVDAGDLNLVVMNGDLWIRDGSAWEFRQQTWSYNRIM
jgi:hypothetical protein